MTGRPHIALRIDASVERFVALRIEWAFRLYCVVAGLRAVEPNRADLVIGYGGESRDGEVIVPATYRSRPAGAAAPPPSIATPPTRAGGLRPLPCFHPIAETGPDLLGEIFEWVSADHERSITESDSVGRPPFAETLHGRYGLSPRVPWATEAMRWLHARLATAWDRSPGWPATLVGPLGRTLVAATHDLDFLPGRAGQTSLRYAKNLAYAVRHDRSIVPQVVAAGASAVVGRNPLDRLAWMVEREQDLGIRSSVNVLCRRAHRRDANYDLSEPRTRTRLRWLADQGVELGVHGSYTSLDGSGGLVREYAALRDVGYDACGGRQHWLRYRGTRLFSELEAAGALYDSSAGFADRVGFRHGASFPFPPWDFQREQPFPLLEIPLAVMEGALEGHDDAVAQAHTVMDNAVSGGWGGVAVLWHDPVFGGTQFNRRIADLYWELKRPGQDWVSPLELTRSVWSAYAECGLLPPHNTQPRETPPPPPQPPRTVAFRPTGVTGV
jgi:hypothetical protein